MDETALEQLGGRQQRPRVVLYRVPHGERDMSFGSQHAPGLVRADPAGVDRRYDVRPAMTGRRSRPGCRGELATASALKLQVSKIVASTTAGRVIGTLTRNRVRHQGLRFDVRSDDFSPRVRAMAGFGDSWAWAYF